MEQLKPCLCGGKSKLKKAKPMKIISGWEDVSFYVCCEKCGLGTIPQIILDDFWRINTEKTKIKAIDIWNNRVKGQGMTKEELAKILNGREYRNEISHEECVLAKENGLVVVFGASDDLCELRGAIDDEVDSYESTTIYLNSNGLLENKCDDEDCPYFLQEKQNCEKIKVLWCSENNSLFSWTFETDIPHCTFEIFEDEYPYCQGIVFSMKDL